VCNVGTKMGGKTQKSNTTTHIPVTNKDKTRLATQGELKSPNGKRQEREREGEGKGEINHQS